MDITQVQLRLEHQSMTTAADKYERDAHKHAERGTFGNSSVASKLLRELDRDVARAISELQATTDAQMKRSWDGKPGRVPQYAEALLAYSPEQLAFFVTRAALTVTSKERTVMSLAIRIGRAIQEQLWLDEVATLEREAAREREYTPANRLPQMRRELKQASGSSRVVAKWKRRLSDLPAREWSQHERGLLGMKLLEVALPFLTVSMLRREDQFKQQVKLVVKSSFVEHLVEGHRAVAHLHPFYLPMVVPPVRWTSDGHHLKGGYLTLRAAGLKGVAVGREGGQHTMLSDISQTTLDAMNLIQSTPWVINGFVLEHARRAFEQDMGPVPYEAEMELPPRMPEDVWEGMSPEERKLHLRDRSVAYSHNFRNSERKLAHTRALRVAADFVEHEAIYFPHAMDWRGRFYPIPQDLHPQGPDMVKALLSFHERKALGERGLVWLEQHAANTYGLDKEDRGTQQVWTGMNWDRIMLVGMDPWLDVEFWQGADEPWQFLAVAHELYMAYASGEPESYESGLPVSIDGSCNGLQHLSAIGLDAEGGAAVNLLPGERQDIYQIVADKVNETLTEDSEWFGKVTRKTVKRAVMTTPYGVTPRGIADQIKKDGFTRGMDDAMSAANDLRDRIVAALAGVVVKGTEIMEWLKDCAKVLAADGSSISWETPAGTVITQKYLKFGHTNIRTSLGDFRVSDPGRNPELVKGDQTKGIAPNLIHSFDAAHLSLVALALPELSHMFIHDSFGTHACDVDTLLDVTKRKFIEIYSEDWFEKLYGTMVFLSGRPALPRPPEAGTLDITKVADSSYFFA